MVQSTIILWIKETIVPTHNTTRFHTGVPRFLDSPDIFIKQTHVNYVTAPY